MQNYPLLHSIFTISIIIHISFRGKQHFADLNLRKAQTQVSVSVFLQILMKSLQDACSFIHTNCSLNGLKCLWECNQIISYFHQPYYRIIHSFIIKRRSYGETLVSFWYDFLDHDECGWINSKLNYRSTELNDRCIFLKCVLFSQALLEKNILHDPLHFHNKWER